MKQVVVLVAVFFLGYFVRSGCAGLIEGQDNKTGGPFCGPAGELTDCDNPGSTCLDNSNCSREEKLRIIDNNMPMVEKCFQDNLKSSICGTKCPS